MPKHKQTKGECQFCHELVAKGFTEKHLSKCAARQAALAKAETQTSKVETLYLLRVQANGVPEFWLDLEVRGQAKLADLDNYLRAIWLECCGHLSQFGDFREEEWDMDESIAESLPVGSEVLHLYDFGTTSETLVKSTSQRMGKPLTKYPIVLLMRNELPETKCVECGAPEAKWFCQECMYEDANSGELCDKCAEGHPHDNYGEPVELVNSPRMGACGYDGPAEPPY
jgi:hypothetical protein